MLRPGDKYLIMQSNMEITTKILAFEYWLAQMLIWGNELNPKVSFSSFSRLKALKLLFFTAAVKDEHGQDLLDIFNNFYALPYGPVESDIYNCITLDRLQYFTFKNFSLEKKQDYCDMTLNEDMKQRINLAIKVLRTKNQKIISYNAEQLVTLSHIRTSWRNAIQIAHALGKDSYKMDISLIRTDVQNFSL